MITRAPARPRRRPRGARRGRARAARRPAGVRRLRHQLLGRRCPPKQSWTCDICGGEVVQRADDTEEAIAERLDLYDLADRARSSPGTRARACCRRSTESGRPTRCTAPHRRGDRRRATSVGRSRPDVGVRKAPRPDRDDAQAGRVVAEMHDRIRDGDPPGVTTAELDRIGRDVLERRGARSNFLGYHGFPAVICASPNDVIVHGIPGPLPCSRRATSSRSTAAPSSTAGTATPRSPRRSATVDAGGAATDRGHRGSPSSAGIAQMVDGQPPVRHRPRRPGGGRGGRASRWCGSTWATPSARPCTRAPTCPNYGTPGKGPQAPGRQGLRRRADGQRRRRPTPWCWTTAGSWSPPTGACSAHFEHTIAITDDGPEILTVP